MKTEKFRIFLLMLVCLLLGKCGCTQTIHEVLARDAYELVVYRDTVNSVMLDGRSAEMFAEKHIEGAVNIDAFEDSLIVKLEQYLEHEEVFVYCTNHRRAELIIETLKKMSFKGDIVFISDGINGWLSSGYEVVDG